ncbi:thioredoxin family protein [Cyanobium sp. Morenito 9A2]|uniref:TlpA family protein disulfide reductase n=1 Tax=Cyanobium sp. Morenito 9A2 TaxID=2823718 RepID=UPI0020CF0CD2|nr:thioredoxin family protein [Cyanobium sp. Morenito 9A2]MCP9849569.1 thioredoxin family protein [Cyanobium sp. Morenito 9A2]
MATVIKFSSEDCGTCHRMAHYDAKVAAELGLEFVSVMLQDTNTYRKYRPVLLSQYPSKDGMGWPTYLVVSDPEGSFEVHGKVKGGLPKGEFRERLAAAAGLSAPGA